MYTLTLGMDVPCYANVQLPDRVATTPEAVEGIARKIAETGEFDGREVRFVPSWDDAAALRIVSLDDADGGTLMEDRPLEESPFDAGLVLKTWLINRGSLEYVVNNAAAFGLIPEPVNELRRRCLVLPDGGEVEVEFLCRRGATPEELDVAFVAALAQVAEIREVP
jgi:hypothetical protein